MQIPQTSLKKLACLQASLALAVVLVLFTGCGMFEGKSEYQKLQDSYQDFSDLVADFGGVASREAQSKAGMRMTGWRIDLSDAEVSDYLIDSIVKFGKRDPVFDLNLSGSTITDAQLVRMDKGEVFQKCYTLNLSNTAITDAGLDQCSNYYIIHELDVTGTEITADAIQRLGDKQLAQKYVPQALKNRPAVKM